MTEKQLGKIKAVSFGIGGYNDAMLGIHFDLGGDSWGVCTNDCAWDPELISRSDYSQWTEEDRNRRFSEIMRNVSKLLKQAKVDTVDKLKGIPVEVTTEGGSLKEWRILTEVL